MAHFRSYSARTIRTLCILLMMAFLPVSTVNAAMVSTDSVLTTEQALYSQTDILHQLDSEDAKAAMQLLGVDQDEIKQRVANMTAEELAQFNAELNELPAGGIGIFGFIVFLLLLMIVLDILGAVDFFPAVQTWRY